MKILCVCNGGNCRSPVVAEVLKGTFGHDAIAIGTYWASERTMAMLCEWADIIAPVEPLAAELPPVDLAKWKASPIWRYTSKLRIAPIGTDRWGHGQYDALKFVCLKAAQELLKA